MPPAIELHYKKRSSLDFYTAPLLAFWGKSKTFEGVDTIPEISTHFSGFHVDCKHLDRFNTICNIEYSQSISPIYPMTLIFVYFQRILSLKQAPLSMYKVLGKRIQIRQLKPINPDENFDIHCKINDIRVVEKGLELDLKAALLSNDETIWTVVETFFYKGKFGEITPNTEPNIFEPISEIQDIASWFLPEGIGYKFAKISGDGNPIHHMKRYAKVFGFERDFAQPFLILGQALGQIMEQIIGQPTDTKTNHPISLDIELKGQCYYNRQITVKGDTENKARFDIYCQGNERPCMVGKLF